MNNCLINALQHVYDVILKQSYPTVYGHTPQIPKHYFYFIIYCILYLDKTEKAFSHELS